MPAAISSQLGDDPSAEGRFHGTDGISRRIRDFARREGSDTMADVETPSMVRRRWGHASTTGAHPSRRRYPTPRSRSGPLGARQRERWRHAPGMANGSRPLIGVIRSSCLRSRRLPGCASCCRSAMDGCWCRRSRSSAARPIRWRPTLRTRLGPAWTCSSVAMRICPTSASLARPIGGWCSASTTSTRPCRGRSSGT